MVDRYLSQKAYIYSMDNITSPLIEAIDLLALHETVNLVIVDASSHPNAKAAYEQNHLAGALFVDLNTQLADIKENISSGGRHPLPTIEQFSQTLSALGISANSYVVIYDHKNAPNAAARFWWMLKSIGHQKVQVLNGGFDEAVKAGFLISKEYEKPSESTSYIISDWQLPLSNITEVEKASQNESYTIIDVRENSRYLGINEPIDLIAGHIPGAVNIPFSGILIKMAFSSRPLH